MVAITPEEVAKDGRINANAKLLYGFINSYCNMGRPCFASNGTLGELIGLEGRSVSRLVSDLQTAGHITVEFETDEYGASRRHISVRKYASDNIKPSANTPTHDSVPPTHDSVPPTHDSVPPYTSERTPPTLVSVPPYAGLSTNNNSYNNNRKEERELNNTLFSADAENGKGKAKQKQKAEAQPKPKTPEQLARPLFAEVWFAYVEAQSGIRPNWANSELEDEKNRGGAEAKALNTIVAQFAALVRAEHGPGGIPESPGVIQPKFEGPGGRIVKADFGRVKSSQAVLALDTHNEVRAFVRWFARALEKAKDADPWLSSQLQLTVWAPKIQSLIAALKRGPAPKKQNGFVPPTEEEMIRGAIEATMRMHGMPV